MQRGVIGEELRLQQRPAGGDRLHRGEARRDEADQHADAANQQRPRGWSVLFTCALAFSIAFCLVVSTQGWPVLGLQLSSGFVMESS